jgi:2-keto-4-pentenoate hydratase/2-oxohepta-3-ene-1,7-dioic acid hydratase in catechol pathway
LRIVRIKADGKTKYGVVEGDSILGYRGSPFGAFKPDGTEYLLKDAKLLPPCTPTKIICLGLNYHAHIAEFKGEEPQNPILFLKPLSAIIGPGDNIVRPNDGRIDFEGELAVVIKRKAKDIGKDKVMDYVLGYTCFNDVTDRIAQKVDGQWTRAKGFDTFASFGPWIDTDLEAGDLLLETYLNGERKQAQRTSELIFDIPTVLSFISGVMTLLPGDIIATGTPSGVGPMKAGDRVEIKIEKLGTLVNFVIDKK